MSAYDALAPSFDRDRALPDGVAAAIRAAALGSVDVARPRVLDLGAGTGRVGWPFVAASDDYVGVDLSFGMLSAFKRRPEAAGYDLRLVQADGHRMPFGDAMFDVVMLIQVFGGISDWRQFAREVRRVLRNSGAVLAGRAKGPESGVDARMKRQLASILGELGVPTHGPSAGDALRMLDETALRADSRVVANWAAERTPRRFLERHRGGARFAALPRDVKDEALRRLGVWAEATFGSLDAASSETFAFELRVFAFHGKVVA